MLAVRGVNAVIFTDCVSFGTIWQRTAGAYRIATELRRAGYTVQVIDFWSFLMLESTELVKGLLDKYVGSDTVFVGWSSTFLNQGVALHHNKPVNNLESRFHLEHLGENAYAVNVDDLLEIKRHILALNPKCDIMLAGARAGQYHDPIATVRVVGYGETQILAYMAWRMGKNPFFLTRNDKGVKVIDNDVKAEGYDFVNGVGIQWHPSDCIQPNETLPIEISRGCIFSCKYCAYPLNGKSKLDYIREEDRLYEEFQTNYDRWGTTRYLFVDDTYNDTTDKLRLINGVRKRLNFDLRFATYLRLDLIAAHPEQAQLLIENGLCGAFFGVESLNPKALKTIGKGMHPEKLVDTLHWLREEVWGNEVLTTAGLMLGLPHDTYATMEAWLERVMDYRFPLHSWILSPLHITNPETTKRSWYSDFDKQPGKYGYELLDSGGWRNTLYGTTHQGCDDLATRVFNYGLRAGRFGFPGHIGISLEDYGVSLADQVLRPREWLVTRSPMYTKVYARYINYVKQLLKLPDETHFTQDTFRR